MQNFLSLKAIFPCSAMQTKLTVQEENIEEMTEKIEVLSEELTKVLCNGLGPVVQSTVSLTRLLRHQLVKYIPTT